MNTNITCRDVANLIYLTEDEISSQETRLLSQHLETCSSCKKIREDFLTTRQATIKMNRDVPAYPDYTTSTENLVKSGSDSALASSIKPTGSTWNKTLSIIRYVSSIAAVLLTFLFIWEQTISVQKISMLETRIQSAINPSSPGLIDRITLARASFTDKELTVLAHNLGINKSELGSNDLIRTKLFLEKRVRSGKISELALINLFMTSGSVKRNTITFKNLIK